MNEGLSKLIADACDTGNLDILLNVIYNYPTAASNIIHGGDRDPTFLHTACKNGHLSIVRQLIEAGANVNQLSPINKTPLSMACENGHLEIAQHLVEKGAIVHSLNSDFENSPVYLACCRGHTDVLVYLICKEPNILHINGQFLLYIAACEGHLGIVKFFVQRRVSVNPPLIPSEDEEQPPPLGALYAACDGKQIDTAKYLIENGALVTSRIVEIFGEDVMKEVMFRYTKDVKPKRKTALSFEQDPEITMFSAAWAHKNLYSLHKSWFVDYSLRLVNIDLANNFLEELPEEIFNTLPALEELDVSNNKLVCLPEITNLSFVRIEKLFAQRNQLVLVPSSLFQLKTLKKINLSHNKLTFLGDHLDDAESGDDETWKCTSLKVLKLTNNNLKTLPPGIQSTSGLVKLFLNRNKLEDFPMPWKCPLETLDLSNNCLSSFTCSVDMEWANSLFYLNLSHNNLETISGNVCQLVSLQDLDVSYNKIRALPPEHYWRCKNMHKMNLSFNKLLAKPQFESSTHTLRHRLFKPTLQDEGQDPKTDCELPVELFSPTLETLLLNDNCLHVVPPTVCKLTSLNELDLSNNPDLKTLPPQLGNLRNCWQLRLTNLTLTDLPKHVRPGSAGVRPKDTLAYLRATLRKSVPYYRMKLMIVGIQGYGKTTLLAALKGQPLPGNLSTVGIVVDEWSVQISNSSLLSRIISPSTGPPTITFSTWDLAGQSVYYAAHQMFLSPSTLYLAVWNATLGDEGIENLRSWLLNIKARAPYSDVIVIGTHLDQLPKQNRESRVEKLKLSIMNKFVDSKGFPKIVGNIVVSATTGDGIQDLKEMIYKKALNAKEQGEKIIGKQVPMSYIQLQDAVIHEAMRRRDEREPPVLMEDEVLALAARNKDNDIHDHDELALATRFLHENGILLHYNDQLRGLNTLYFIDPAWVCDLIASIVTVREKNGYVRDGIMKTKNVQLVLRDPRFPPQFISQYLQLMERFEIALALDDAQLLIPSMLPRESPGMKLNELHKFFMPKKLCGGTAMTLPHTPRGRGASMMDTKRKAMTLDGSETWHGIEAESDDAPGGGNEKAGNEQEIEGSHDMIRRNYQMAYVPSGLWSRLITRLMVSLQRWRQTEGIDEDRFSMIYWRKGIGVVYEGGHFLVQAYRELVPLSTCRSRTEELEGISVEVWSHIRDFSVMGFIVDQIDALISEWYPGLDDTDTFGFPLVRRLIPCPRCTISIRRRSSMFRRSASLEYPSHSHSHHTRPYNFSLSTCAASALNFATITCPFHPEIVVSLDELIPDLLMTDLPRSLLVERGDFTYRTDEASRLGGGGAGEVFRGELRKEFVAVKTFHSTRTSSLLLDSGLGGESGVQGMRSRSEGLSMRRAGLLRSDIADEDNVEDELEKTKVVRAFWDLRQEVAVLCHLNHPCVVRLLGVCLHPLCFLLELAPRGSLANVLEDITMGHEAGNAETKTINPNTYTKRQSTLGRGLTYKIAYQVASALWYLHDCNIIYRDLKADNVLVWSLDDTELVNIKLSDYGISCFATPQGVAGDEGTPGYQAPEVRSGVGYDEKVDIFSFAIFLFELISGRRPFRNYRSAVDIKKDIRRNIRPSLEDLEIESQLPRLEQVMRWSWLPLPERRPSADTLLREMEEPGFLCQCRIMPDPDKGEVLEKITAVYGLSQTAPCSPQSALSSNLAAVPKSSVLLWSRERDRRTYSWLNCETGEFQGHEESCPGPRVLCMVQVGKRTWLGTEGCTIQVFGRRSWQLPNTLCSFLVKAPVLALLTEESSGVNQDATVPGIPPKPNSQVSKVYAALANGTVVVFTHISATSACQSHDDVIIRHTDDTDDIIMAEMSHWCNIQVINLGQSSNPAKSMVLVKDSRELWVGCGNKIVVMDTQTLAVVDEIAVYSSQRAHIRKMVVLGDKVWSIDRRSTKILEWDVHTRQLSMVFDLEVKDSIGKVVCSQFTDTSAQDIGEDEASLPGNTLPRWKGNSATPHAAATPPSYTEAEHAQSGDRQSGTKVLVDRALGDVSSLTRSGAVKRKSLERPITPPDHPPREGTAESRDQSDEHSPNDLFKTQHGEDTLNTLSERVSKQSAVAEALSRVEAFAKASGSSIEELAALQRLATSADSGFEADELLEEAAGGAEDRDENRMEEKLGEELSDETRGVAIDNHDQSDHACGESEDDDQKLEKWENENQNSDGTTEEESIADKDNLESKLNFEQDSEFENGEREGSENEEKGTENGSGAPAFEFVDRKDVIVEQAKERIEAKRTLFYDKETASMSSLKITPQTVQRGPSLMRSWKRSKRKPTPASEGAASPRKHAQRPRLQVMMGSVNKVMTLQMIGGTLWVGRGRGDIVIINIDPQAEDCQYGEVLARMEFENRLNYENGQIDEIINTGNNKVVCCRRLEPIRIRKAPSKEKLLPPQSPKEFDPSTERYQLIVLEAWGRKEFQAFKSHLERFNALMD